MRVPRPTTAGVKLFAKFTFGLILVGFVVLIGLGVLAGALGKHPPYLDNGVLQSRLEGITGNSSATPPPNELERTR